MKISLGQQIDELRRELDQRRLVYPRLIAGRKLRQSVADYQMARLQAAFDTLLWLQRHEAAIRAAVGSENEGADGRL